MKNHILIFCFIISLSISANAQMVKLNNKNRNTIGLESVGPAYGFSLCYERLLLDYNAVNIPVRIGFGYVLDAFAPRALYIPISVGGLIRMGNTPISLEGRFAINALSKTSDLNSNYFDNILSTNNPEILMIPEVLVGMRLMSADIDGYLAYYFKWVFVDDNTRDYESWHIGIGLGFSF